MRLPYRTLIALASTRRTFLRTASVVYTLGCGGAAFARSGAGEVRRGFIGSGVRGKQLIDEFAAVADRAISDRSDGGRQRAQEQLGDAVWTGRDYRALLDGKEIDAVVIATPDHWHEKITLDALFSGEHVYIEKPMTWFIAEGPRLIAAAKASGKVLQVGSQAKTSALTAKAREIVASGALGKVNRIRMAKHRNSAEGAWQYPAPPDASEKTIDWPAWQGRTRKRAFEPAVVFQWRRFWEYSGGVAADLFVYQFTQMHEIMGVRAPRSAV